MNTFSPSAMIAFGWETFKKRPWFFIGAFLIVSIVSSGARFQSGEHIQYTATTIAMLIAGGLIMAVVQIFAKMGAINVALKAQDDTTALSLWDLWAPHPFWRYVGASIVVGVIVLVGFILLIVPGIIWALRYMFVPYLVMEKNLKPFEALKESARITYGHKWQLAGLLGLIFLVNILGLLCLIVGLLVSVPVTALAVAHAYRTLSAQTGTATVA